MRSGVARVFVLGGEPSASINGEAKTCHWGRRRFQEFDRVSNCDHALSVNQVRALSHELSEQPLLPVGRPLFIREVRSNFLFYFLLDLIHL